MSVNRGGFGSPDGATEESSSVFDYTAYRFLYPPRPGSAQAIPKGHLPLYERRGFVAQFKLNGTNNLIAVSPDKKLFCMRRDNTAHNLWKPTEDSSRIFRKLVGKGWYVFVAELMHSKVADDDLRDTNYIHEILVEDGHYLVGTTQAERQAILHRLFLKDRNLEKMDQQMSHYVLDDHTWLVKEHKKDFAKLFEFIVASGRPEYEGLVLKKSTATLELCAKETSNASWLKKCRKPHKNYGF